MNAWRADPLVWGHGPRIFEVFLEPTCPFFVKTFGKLDDLLDQAGEDRITVKLHLQSQPWHMYSGVIVRCILAASTLEGGKTAAKSVMAAVAAHREEFEFDRRCRGPNLDATPNDIIRRIERYSGVKLAEGPRPPPVAGGKPVYWWPRRMHDPSRGRPRPNGRCPFRKRSVAVND